jgi:uncharacterized protein YndB with AHSA1/START domain
MSTLYHEIKIVSSPSQVWAALTTRQGLISWWPNEVSISGGDSWCLSNSSGSAPMIMKVVEDIPDQALEWLCVQGPEDWENTLIHWRLDPQGQKQRLVLEHRDLRQDLPQLASLNTFWGVSIERLRHSMSDEINSNDEADLGLWT